MAKLFSHPQIKTLAVGESTNVFNTDPALLKRRADAFGKRSGRRFQYDFGEVMHLVTRLPDPVADTELPDVP